MNKFWILSILSASLYSTTVFASCTSTGATQTEDDRTALIPFGTVNLNTTYLQPVGTLLDSIVVPSTNYTFGGATASTILWTCAESDLPNIQFLVATNGDDRVGGYWDLGAADGIPNTYATYFEYVGLKQTMAGVTLTRFWKAVPVTSYQKDNGKIHIRLQDIPPLQAELYRISQLAPGNGSGSAYCGRGTSGQILTGSYSCIQPNSYIQLQGPGLTHDNVGEDSNDHYRFWWVDNGFGYGMRNVNTLYNNPSCVARTATPLVLFRTISVEELNNNQTAETNFNVSIECSNQVNSGVGSGQTAIGLQVSSGAYTAASQLNLVNSSSGVAALLSDHYGDSNIAKGIGIYLRNANTNTDMLFVGQKNVYLGQQSGWYPVLAGAQNTGSTQAGYTHYNHTFTAILKKLTGTTENVTAGKVKSTAYVLVRVQ